MKSMTGYGKATGSNANKELTIELKSVNHRYLDVNVKMPRCFVAYEDLIKKQIATHINRGHIDVFVNYLDKNDTSKKVIIDFALAKNILDAAHSLKKEFDLKDDFQLNALLKTGDVMTFEVGDNDDEEMEKLIVSTIDNACEQLEKMRMVEGEKLTKGILERIAVVENYVKEIKEYAPKVVADYREKLTARITEALGNVALDEARLINEVAYFADKSNIDEEIDRLVSHIAQARKMLNSLEPNGRKLDFLIQEFNREANTICSKSNNVNVTNLAVELKNEIEKIREQIQNIE